MPPRLYADRDPAVNRIQNRVLHRHGADLFHSGRKRGFAQCGTTGRELLLKQQIIIFHPCADGFKNSLSVTRPTRPRAAANQSLR